MPLLDPRMNIWFKTGELEIPNSGNLAEVRKYSRDSILVLENATKNILQKQFPQHTPVVCCHHPQNETQFTFHMHIYCRCYLAKIGGKK